MERSEEISFVRENHPHLLVPLLLARNHYDGIDRMGKGER